MNCHRQSASLSLSSRTVRAGVQDRQLVQEESGLIVEGVHGPFDGVYVLRPRDEILRFSLRMTEPVEGVLFLPSEVCGAYPELKLRSFAEFTLSRRPRSFVSLRMTGRRRAQDDSRRGAQDAFVRFIILRGLSQLVILSDRRERRISFLSEVQHGLLLPGIRHRF